ncbi:MAG: DUF4031 domain-containing protein [Actinomycetota bacterium]
MTILVDEARWPWRGARWAHLVSDVSYDELHEFARQLGKRRLGFQGDHYDVEEVDRERALAFGATAVESRELVRRLRGAGLRDRAAKPAWRRISAWPEGVMPRLDDDFAARLAPASLDLVAATVAAFEDPVHRVLLVDLRDDVELPEFVDPSVIVSGVRPDRTRSIEVFLTR